MEVGAEVEAATIITIMVAMRQSTQARCTMSNRRHHIATGAVDFLTTTNMDLPRTPLGHRHHHINIGRDTDRAVPGRTHRNPRTAETRLTQMAAAETHRGQCLARIIGADITLDPRAEAVTVGVVVVAAAAAAEKEEEEEEEDTMLVVVVGVDMVIVMEIAEEEEEEDSEMPRRIRAATILVCMMVAIAQAAVDRHEGAVEVEVTESLANVRTRARPLLLLSPSFGIINCFFICLLLVSYLPQSNIRGTLSVIDMSSFGSSCSCTSDPTTHRARRHHRYIDVDDIKGYKRCKSRLHVSSIPRVVATKKNKWKYSCAQGAGTCTTPRLRSHLSTSPISMWLRRAG